MRGGKQTTCVSWRASAPWTRGWRKLVQEFGLSQISALTDVGLLLKFDFGAKETSRANCFKWECAGSVSSGEGQAVHGQDAMCGCLREGSRRGPSIPTCSIEGQ